jgi:general secretion pathway protein D
MDWKRCVAVAVIVIAAEQVRSQVPLPPGFSRVPATPPPAQEPPKPSPTQQQPPGAPAPQTPKPGETKPAEAKPPEGTTTTPPQLSPAATGGLNLQNASLTEVIDILARQLKINYILDPRVRGGVTINTYGDTKGMDPRSLLDTILRINGAAMIQVGDLYRIVPLADVQRLPLQPEIEGKPVPEDDRTMLNLVFLKYATVDELAKLLNEFLGEHAKMWSYPAANLLIIQDSRRNMKRLMELVSLFDNDTFANQRVRLFEVENGRPSDVAKELEGILRSISLSEKSTPVKLIPVDRINTLIAVAPNPGVFNEVETWLKKLDIAVESSAGTINNFVYRVKYGFAPTIGMAIMGLYSNNPMYAMSMMMMSGMGMGGMGMGNMYTGPMGGGMGMGGMYGGGGMFPGAMGGMGMGMGGMYGGGMYGPGMFTGGMYASPVMPTGMPGLPASPATATAATPGAAAAATDLTGTYLGTAPAGGAPGPRTPRIIPNPFDNTLLIQATRQEYDAILRLLRDIDVPPRQVLIEAKIYEVTLTGAFASGVAAVLQNRSPNTRVGGVNQVQVGGAGVNLSATALVGQTRELLAFLTAQETSSRARVISAPSVVATDSVPASINVGTEVPTLTAQAVTGVQQGGNSLFANSVQNRNSGVTLQIMTRVNPSGIVTMTIAQEVSAPIPPPPTAAIQSPSFSKRSVQTQVTVQDGDTVAIGGIINESGGNSSAGIPGLHRIPIIGAAFGSRSYNKEKTELIIFLTPRVIYDMNDIVDATDELKSGLRRLTKHIQE